jgi:hypothetical protein
VRVLVHGYSNPAVNTSGFSSGVGLGSRGGSRLREWLSQLQREAFSNSVSVDPVEDLRVSVMTSSDHLARPREQR